MLTKTSNVNAYKAPTLWVTIDDLRIPVAVPTLDMTEDLLERCAHVADLENGLTENGLTEEGYADAFDLFAAVLSCNHNYRKFTPEELMAKKITVEQILGVLADWAVFLGEIASLKN